MSSQLTEKWSRAIGVLPAGVALSESGVILAANRDFVDSVGMAEHAILGRSCLDILSPFRPACWQCPLAAALRSKHETQNTEAPEKEAVQYGPDSPSPPRRPLCLPLEGADRNLRVHLLYSRPDATRLLALLTTMERLRFTEDRVAYMVHELNNYLSVISGHAELMLMDDPSLAREHAAVIFRAADRCRTILIEARNWHSTAPPNTQKNLSVKALIEEATETCRFALRTHHAQIVSHVDGNVPPIRANATEMVQVLSNIIINAAQAGRQTSVQTEISIEAHCQDDWLTIQVTDNGPGIPDRILPQIFEPYFTTKPDGTGLGLAITKALVERAGGKIEVETSSLGTSVRISLPHDP